MFFWQQPFSSSAITHASFLAQGGSRSQLQCEVPYHPPWRRPLPAQLQEALCLLLPERGRQPALLAVWILSSLIAVCSLLEQTGRSWNHENLLLFSPTLEDVFPQGVRNDRDPDIPSLSCFATFPWKRGQVWFATRDRWLLLQLIWFWLLVESGLCSFVMSPLLIPPAPQSKCILKRKQMSLMEKREVVCCFGGWRLVIFWVVAWLYVFSSFLVFEF